MDHVDAKYVLAYLENCFQFLGSWVHTPTLFSYMACPYNFLKNSFIWNWGDSWLL